MTIVNSLFSVRDWRRDDHGRMADASVRCAPGVLIMARSSRARPPNRALRALLNESGWTEDMLAREVNALAAEIGRVMRLDRRSVSHWLSGRHPRPPTPGLIAEALSRRLRRAITAADIGMDPRLQEPYRERFRGYRVAGPRSSGVERSPREPTADIDENAAAALRRLAPRPGSRRPARSGEVYKLDELIVPNWEEAVIRQSIHPIGADSVGANDSVAAAPRLRAEQVTAPERMVRAFSDLDSAFGGGHSRGALAAYLGYDIAPRLRAKANATIRRKLLSAATQLTYLCGFMCFDDEQNPMAQQYYRTALNMAAEAGDREAYAITLRALSVQAHTLGHHRHALQLAEAATASGVTRMPPEQQAFLYGQLAVATAADGDRTRALSALAKAERCLSRATTDSPVGGYHAAALEYQQAVVQARLNDLPAAMTVLRSSLRHRPSTERRSRSITLARLGELQLRQGHLEEAVATWHAFVDDYSHLRSGRATRAMTLMQSRLRPFAANPVAARLITRAATIRPPAG